MDRTAWSVHYSRLVVGRRLLLGRLAYFGLAQLSAFALGLKGMLVVEEEVGASSCAGSRLLVLTRTCMRLALRRTLGWTMEEVRWS